METNVKEILDLAGEIKPKERELLERAYAFSEKAHEGQKRLNGDPYFVHVFETAKILAKLGMDTQTIAAGLLHDVLEDTKIKEVEIEKNFNKHIVFLINGVT